MKGKYGAKKVTVQKSLTFLSIIAILSAGVAWGYGHFAKTSQLEQVKDGQRRVQYNARQYDYRSNKRYYETEQRRLREHNQGSRALWPAPVQEEYRRNEQDLRQNRDDWDEYREGYRQKR